MLPSEPVPFIVISIILTANAGNKDYRIYGGEPRSIEEFPYQIQLLLIPKNPTEVLTPICGGSIIGQKVVLTAGHCVSYKNKKPDANKYLVRAGTSYRAGDGGSLHRISRIMLHEDYVLYTTPRSLHLHQDIAIMMVDPPFEFDKTRQRIPIAVTSAQTGEEAIASGWGAIELDASSKIRPDVLQATTLHIMSYEICRDFTDWTDILDERNLCAGNLGDASTCRGDSGGPLAVNGRLVGITSWVSSRYCVRLKRPPVFTNVTAYLPWIQAQTINEEDIIYEL